ncbi:uncharacterized protein LOC143222606 isoform X1 [Tachypleus tridentatus]|uniref:uncharacterized protein LOC143222606 isoform X1 n=1 Tax=Tachypleus tridentatus TaxID=6853 RepID=UPI003FD228AA
MVVVDVLDGSTSRSKWYAGFGYSIPAIVVGISAAIDPGSFGNGVNVCWLEYGNFYVMSFVGPVGASIIVSIVLLIFVYHRISQRSDSGMAGKNKEGVKNSIIRAWCTNSMCVLVVLSLTWSSCLWYLYDTSPITIYLFAVSNSLQGALLFILYCVVESQVRIAICDGIRSISWFEACVNSSKPVVSPPSQYIYTNDMMNISVSPISGHESVGNLVLPTPVSSSSAVSPAVMEISELPNRNQEFPQTSSTLPALPLPSSGMFSADTEDWMPVSSRYCYDARGSCIKSQLLLFSPDVNRRLENCRLTYTTEHIYETIDRDSVVNQYDSQSCTSEDYNAHSFCHRISTDEGSLRNDNTLTLSSRETRADRYNSSSQRSHHLTLDAFSNVRQCTTVILDSRSVHSPGFHSRCLQKSNNVLSQQVAIEDFESVRKQDFEKEDYINKPSSSENDHSCCLTSVHSVLSVNKEVLENSP